MATRLLRHIASTVLLLLAACALASAAQIYKHVDAEGNVTFSDQPPAPGESAEEVELPELNTTPAIDTSAAPERESASSEPPEQAEFDIRIASPDDETTIAMGPGNVTVTAQATPPLRRLEQVQLYLDGEAFGEPRNSMTWALQGLMRGPHDLAVERLDRDGNSLARSESVRIYVLRPSVNQPRRR